MISLKIKGKNSNFGFQIQELTVYANISNAFHFITTKLHLHCILFKFNFLTNFLKWYYYINNSFMYRIIFLTNLENCKISPKKINNCIPNAHFHRKCINDKNFTSKSIIILKGRRKGSHKSEITHFASFAQGNYEILLKLCSEIPKKKISTKSENVVFLP